MLNRLESWKEMDTIDEEIQHLSPVSIISSINYLSTAQSKCIKMNHSGLTINTLKSVIRVNHFM